MARRAAAKPAAKAASVQPPVGDKSAASKPKRASRKTTPSPETLTALGLERLIGLVLSETARNPTFKKLVTAAVASLRTELLPRVLVVTPNLPEAEALVRRALALDARNPHASEAMARISISRGDGAEGVSWARKAIAVRPRRPNYHVLLGEAYQLQGDAAQARAAWEEALRLDPNNRDAQRHLQ